jgi:hypothetical protein
LTSTDTCEDNETSCVRLLTSTGTCEDNEQGGTEDRSLVSKTSREDRSLVSFICSVLWVQSPSIRGSLLLPTKVK